VEYHSPRNTGQFNRRNNVVELEAKQTAKHTNGGVRLLCIGVVAAAIGASVPFGAKLLELTQQYASSPKASAVAFKSGIVICRGGDRKARKVTCLVDGDTGWENGVKWRLQNIDTPELNSPDCSNERRKATQARDRLRDLMNGGYHLEWTGSSGSYGRELVRIRLRDGRYAGDILKAEGLAQSWPNFGNMWCSG
jgi:endonuclease YncB( thermonuclease family)